MFQDLSRRLIKTGFFCGFETRLKLIKFGLWKRQQKTLDLQMTFLVLILAAYVQGVPINMGIQ